MWLLLVLRQPAQVKLHLPGMLRAEFLQLEVHGHKPPQFAMIEQQVDIRVLTTSARKPPLKSARFEAEIALLPFDHAVPCQLRPTSWRVRPYRARMRSHRD